MSKETVALTAEQTDMILSKFEVRASGIIKRLMVVNDVYGSPTMRTAILDDMNTLIRETREWLTSTQPSST